MRYGKPYNKEYLCFPTHYNTPCERQSEEVILYVRNRTEVYIKFFGAILSVKPMKASRQTLFYGIKIAKKYGKILVINF